MVIVGAVTGGIPTATWTGRKFDGGCQTRSDGTRARAGASSAADGGDYLTVRVKFCTAVGAPPLAAVMTRG